MKIDKEKYLQKKADAIKKRELKEKVDSYKSRYSLNRTFRLTATRCFKCDNFYAFESMIYMFPGHHACKRCCPTMDSIVLYLIKVEEDEVQRKREENRKIAEVEREYRIKAAETRVRLENPTIEEETTPIISISVTNKEDSQGRRVQVKK